MDFMPESTAGTSHVRAHQISTGKRTGHQRPGSPFSRVVTTSSSYSGGGGEGNSTDDGGCTGQSPMMSSEEEEDMANCLIMLAQSVSPVKEDKSDLYCQTTEKLKMRSVTEMVTTTGGGNSGFLSYECKTCNRAFPSFQALGGHRASHKKPKLTVDDRNSGSIKTEFSKEDRPQLLVEHDENKIITNNQSPTPAARGFIQTGHKNIKGKVHECSICGSEFLSGQALGGHMRRHRTAPPSINLMSAKITSEVTISTDKNDTSAHHIIEKSPVLSLDLNLPATEAVEDGHSNFQFTASSSQKDLVFSAAALVDCYY